MMSDADLRREVEIELSTNSAVNGREVGVSARDGVVTLTGYVETYLQSWEAEKATKRLHGVKGVANDIRVKPSGLPGRTDTDIAEAALRALDWNSAVPNDKIKVVVRDGFLTLEGEVDAYYQKASAETSVRSLTGVMGVNNSITIKPPQVDVSTIKRKIEDTFRRNALLDANRIQVTATGHDVTLRGTVHSYAEREEASSATWATPGVTHVFNELTIAT